jgi:hypothetical protein
MIQDQIERHTGSLRKFPEAGSLDRSNMDEHVKATIVGHDEAETGPRRTTSQSRSACPTSQR